MSNGQTALITGASTGIGAVYAERLAGRGYDLVLVARDSERLERNAKALRNAYGIRAEVLAADLTRPEDLARLEARLATDERISLLVNNAGAAAQGGFLDQSPDDVSKVITLNVTSLARLSSAIAPRLARAGNGAIVNIASVLGLAPELAMGVYGATKAFVLSLTQALAIELGPKGVYVQAVLPAATRTEIWHRSGRDIAQLPAVMEPTELVDAALVGFDRRETVTIPPLPDAGQWDALEAARKAMLPNFRQPHAAARYRIVD